MPSPGATREGGGGRYTLFGEIARGPVTRTHLGRLVDAAGVARTVAIKKLDPELAKAPGFVDAFFDEVRLAAPVRQQNVVRTLDVVRDGAELLWVTEYVPGETLAGLSEAARAQGELFDVRVACAVLVGALEGLHAAHEAKNEFGEPLGIVHRDVSPENVLVGVDGACRVESFGVTKALGPGQRLAQIPHMSPEQVRGGTVTRGSDLWAAGVVLWETLAGRALFAGADEAELMRSVVSADVPDLVAAAPRVPPALGAVVRKAISRAPGDRFPTARAMAIAIDQAVPLALPSEVSAYVARLSGEALGERSARVRAVESAGPDAPGAAIIPSSEFIADALWKDLPKTTARPHAATPPLAPAHSFAPARAPSPVARPAPVPQKALAPAPAPSSARPAAVPPGRRSAARWAVPVTGAVLLGALALALGPWLIPGYAKDQAILAARARGVSLAIGEARGGYSGVHFERLTASIPDVPGLAVKIADVDVELSSFRPVRARLDHVDVSLDGSFARVLANVTLWYRGHRGGGGESPADGVRVEVSNAKVVWTEAIGEGRVEAEEISGELAPKVSMRLGDELRFTTSRLSFKTRSGTVGPWRADVEQDPDATTVRVAFDPPVPDGPRAIITRMATGKTLVDVDVPRSPLARLGIPGAALGSPGRAVDQADLEVHYTKTADDRVDATLALGLYGLKVPPMPGPTEVHLRGAVGGAGSSPLELASGVLGVGPVKATLTGPVVLRSDGLGADLAWRAVPVPCERLLPKSAQAAADLAAELGALGTGGSLSPGDLTSLGVDVAALAQSAGLARASGTLSASGTLVFDTSDLAATAFTVTGKNTCGLVLLGAPAPTR